MTITLPDSPVDGYTIVAWYTGYEEPKRTVAVYHTDTPWDAWAETHYHGMKGGKRIFDDWMIDGPLQGGRIHGWSNIVELFADDVDRTHERYVATEDEALQICFERAKRYADGLEEQARLARGLALSLWERRKAVRDGRGGAF